MVYYIHIYIKKQTVNLIFKASNPNMQGISWRINASFAGDLQHSFTSTALLKKFSNADCDGAGCLVTSLLTRSALLTASCSTWHWVCITHKIFSCDQRREGTSHESCLKKNKTPWSTEEERKDLGWKSKQMKNNCVCNALILTTPR